MDEIKKLNNLTSNLLTVGDILIIPTVGTSNDLIYTVKPGDSLYLISKKYDIEVEKLKKYNNLVSDMLQIGQLLKIPRTTNETFVDYINYVVKKGDSLYSIASNYNLTVPELKKFNGLSSDLLSIGQIIKIPVAIQENINENDNNSNNYILYIVQPGDNLYSISKKYGISQEEIMSMNNLNSNLLKIGQSLKIPIN